MSLKQPFPAFAELRVKSNFSFLRGASFPDELVQRSAELGLHAMALTDHDGVYGLPKAYLAAKEFPQLKLISGADLRLEGYPRLTLLAKNRAGYGLMCRILTASFKDKAKGESSLSLSQLETLMSDSERAGRGLIALADPGSAYSGLKELFEDRLVIPLSFWLDGRDRLRAEKARQLSKQYEIPIVATNDVHFHVSERRRLQDVLTGIREGVTLDQAGKRLFSNAERFLKSPFEMRKLFKEFPEAIQKTVELAEVCTFSLSELKYQYPSEWIPAGETAQSFLIHLVWEGADWRYPSGVPSAVCRQLEHELQLIAELGYADYFLTIWDVVEFARREKILCQGRGSAANSAVCFVLGITAVDPVQMDLLFERFISAERDEPPDIDVDFEHERREEVIQYIYGKYGRDRAAMVSAVVTYRRKSAIREVSKVLGREVSRDEFEKLKSDPFQEQVEVLSKELKGFPRHLSIHSGGFVLSASSIIEMVPVEPARMEGRTIIQWDKYDLDALGLLKIDLLSLGMLTAIRKALDLVGRGTITSIPQEDPATYRMIQQGKTVGVFQIESRAQMNMLGRLQPRCFYDLVIEIAIVRPGPIVGKMVHPYLRRRRGWEEVRYEHPLLEGILSKTLGVPLFQEQVMKIAIQLAGFNPGEADRLRKAIGAWRSMGSIEDMGGKLVRGLIRKGLSQEFAFQVFNQIKGFAEYGFPESHSISFALLAYASSYLKCHHPAELTCALINSQPMGFYANHTLIDEAKRQGVTVLPIDPNESDWDCAIPSEKTLRLGWRVLKGFGRSDADRLLEERERGGGFGRLLDFLERAASVGLRRDHFETMALGGVFDVWGQDPRHALWDVLAFDLYQKKHSGCGTGHGTQYGETPDLFSQVEGFQNQSNRKEKLFSAFDSFEAVQADYASFGLSTKSHPMLALRQQTKGLPPFRSVHAKLAKHQQTITVAGMVIIRQRPPTAKGVCFATLEDEDGFLDLVLNARVFKKFHDLFLNQAFLVIRGVLQKDGHATSVLVDRVQAFPRRTTDLRLPRHYPVRPGGY